MGAKLEGFLRVLAAGLSPQAYQAQTAETAAQTAGVRAQEAEQRAVGRDTDKENLKIITGGIAAKMAIIKDMGVNDPRAKKIAASMKESIDSAPERFQNSLRGAVGDELAAIGGLGKPQKGKSFAALDEKGRPVMAIENEKGQIVDATTFEHKPLWTKAPTRAEQAGPGGFAPKTKSDIQEQQLKTLQGKDRVEKIREGFKPEFTEIGTKASVKFTALTEKLGIKPSAASKKELAEYTRFARNTVQNLNQHIRDRTGAVMNAAEIPRMMAEVPNLGDGILDGDSATQFQSKTEGLLKSYDAAEARLAYVAANGLTPDKAERTPDGEWKTVSSSGLSLEEFKDLPSPPENVDKAGWDKMAPADRRRLVQLINAKRAK